MTLKYFLTMWLEKISELALVLVKKFWMSVDHYDEIVMGQIALEQQGCKGEGTWISSWGLDEVSFIKYCWNLWSSYCQTLWYSNNLPIFLYLIVVSFSFQCDFGIILWESSGFMSCGKKKKGIFLALLPFLVLILKRLKSWVWVFVLFWFVVGFCFVLFFFQKNISKETALWSSGFFFNFFFFAFSVYHGKC